MTTPQQGGPGWVPIPNDGTHQGQPRPNPDVIGEDGTWPMLGGRGGPCRTWPVMPGCGCLPPDATTWDDAQRSAVESATEILWRLTGGQFGMCREVLRPCRTPQRAGLPPLGAPYPAGPYPTLDAGQWINVVCGCGSDSCSCGPVSEIRLPGPIYWEPPRPWWPAPTDERPTPPRYALEVYIDGVELPSSAYTVYNGNRLVRTDGGRWPDCQYIDRPFYLRPDDPPEWSAQGTFGVIYWRGTPVPSSGQRAVALLACEIWKACQGDDSCRLPARVREVNREGVSYTVVDPQNFLDEGRTGLTEVDLWLASVNPRHQREPSTVWSVDLRRHRRQWTTGTFPDLL